jgi:hypothetical protein
MNAALPGMVDFWFSPRMRYALRTRHRESDLDRLSAAPDGGGASATSTEPGGPATGEHEEEQSMAKGQKRSTREPKKPKKAKPKTAAAAVSPFARVQAKPAPSGAAPKK